MKCFPSLSLLRTKAIMWLGSEFCGRACASSSVLYTTLPALLGNTMLPNPQPASPTPVTTFSDNSTTHGLLPSSIFPNSSSRICSSKWHRKLHSVVVLSIASSLVLSRCCYTPSWEEWSRAESHGLCCPLGVWTPCLSGRKV